MAGFLSLGRALKVKLEGELPDNVHVAVVHSLEDYKLAAQLVPAVAIAYAGGDVAESRPDGKAVRLAQHWLVVVQDRNLQDLDSGLEALSASGDLVDQVLDSLLGWNPDSVAKPFSLTGLPTPRYLAGYQEVALRFSTEFVRKSSR